MSGGADDFATARAHLIARPGFGSARRRALTRLTDEWLAKVFAASGAGTLGCALVAIGGYGREELAPGSDIDVLLLHPAGVAVDDVAQRIWYPVWDSGVRLDHSVRTSAGARRLAAQDLRVMLGLLDARTIAGDDRLTAGTRSRILGDWRAKDGSRFDELLASVQERRDVHGELAHLLEPDLKESFGGLRDLTVLRALTASWLVGTRLNGLGDARSVLLDARDALHRSTGRATDRLIQQEQPGVAGLLGYADEDELLRAVCAAGRAVAFASSRAWADIRRQGTSGPGAGGRRIRRPGVRRPLAEGVVVHNGEVVLAAQTRPDRDAGLVLRVAAAAAQADLPVSAHTVDRLARESAPLPSPWPRSARESLVSLLGSGRPLVAVWEAFDQAGLICALIPGWDAVRSLPQRDPVHRHAVDRHLVETVVGASAHTRGVSRPDLLLVAALLHDIGKGRGGDHSVAGADLMAGLAAHMGFGPEDADVLVRLVRHHLLLADVATRRDIDDPAIVATVAGNVGTVEVLELLYRLTVADATATGPAAWSPWKANLTQRLVGRARALLAGDQVDVEPALEGVPGHFWAGRGVQVHVQPLDATELVVTVAAPDSVGLLSRCAGGLALSRLAIREAVSTTVGGRAVLRWIVHTQFGDPPAPDRLTADLRRALAGELDLAEGLRRREQAYQVSGLRHPGPVVTLAPESSSRTTALQVRAHDRAGLLYWIAGALADAGVDVHGAKVSTLGSEVVDVFFLADRAGGPLSEPQAQAARLAVVQALAD